MESVSEKCNRWNIIDLVPVGVPCSTCNIKTPHIDRHWGLCEENPRVSPQSRGDKSTSKVTSFDKRCDRSNKSTTGTPSGVWNGRKQKEKDSQGKWCVCRWECELEPKRKDERKEGTNSRRATGEQKYDDVQDRPYCSLSGLQRWTVHNGGLKNEKLDGLTTWKKTPKEVSMARLPLHWKLHLEI